jgi:hypothetical protein
VNTTIICDESSLDKRFHVLGAVIMPTSNHRLLTAEIGDWKCKAGLNPASEFKWTRVSRGYLEHYKSLVRWFFDHLCAQHLSFRAHVVDTAKRAYRQYGNGDLETAFYKTYYHLIRFGVRQYLEAEGGGKVLVLLDDKRDEYPFRLDVLKKALNGGLKRELGIESAISSVEPRQSSGPHSEPLIQVVDILIGGIAFVRNEEAAKAEASPAKLALIRFIESQAGTPLSFDTVPQARFNIWTFDVERSMRAKEQRELITRAAKKNRPES